MKKATKKMGRPRMEGPRDRTRQIGRVPDEVWEGLKIAAKKSGLNFTQWALNTLCQEAKITRKHY